MLHITVVSGLEILKQLQAYQLSTVFRDLYSSTSLGALQPGPRVCVLTEPSTINFISDEYCTVSEPGYLAYNYGNIANPEDELLLFDKHESGSLD